MNERVFIIAARDTLHNCRVSALLYSANIFGFAPRGKCSSYLDARFSSVFSDQKFPINCRPIGRPSLEIPHGTLMAGTPARFADTV